jgi:Golgi nucleoside diphosphatase
MLYRFIFRFYVDNNEEKVNVMRGKKVKLGISSFADHIEDVADYFTPIFLDATNYIPIEYQSKTEIFIKGTAGTFLYICIYF